MFVFADIFAYTAQRELVHILFQSWAPTDYLNCIDSEFTRTLPEKSPLSSIKNVEKRANKKSITTRDSPIDYVFKFEYSDNGLFVLYFMESYNRKDSPDIRKHG
jgi:hypothetical protein